MFKKLKLEKCFFSYLLHLFLCHLHLCWFQEYALLKLDPWGLFHCLAHDHKSTQEFNYHVISSSSWSLNSKIFILRSCSHMRHKCKCKCKYKKYMGELHQCIYKHKCKCQLKVWKKFHFLVLATALANTRTKKWFHATMAKWSWKQDGVFHFWREVGRECKEIYSALW